MLPKGGPLVVVCANVALPGAPHVCHCNGENSLVAGSLKAYVPDAPWARVSAIGVESGSGGYWKIPSVCVVPPALGPVVGCIVQLAVIDIVVTPNGELVVVATERLVEPVSDVSTGLNVPVVPQ